MSSVVLDGWAWLPKSEFSLAQLESVRSRLSITPKSSPGFPVEDSNPIELFRDTPSALGIARQFFIQHRKSKLPIEQRTTKGLQSLLPSRLEWDPQIVLRPEQQQALDAVSGALFRGSLGGMVKAPCGWGKTLHACSLIQKLQVPTLIVVHKEFLVKQWRDKLVQYMPSIQIGTVQQDECTYLGKHVVIGMVHSLASRDYGEAFYKWPGLVLVDEAHRIGARSWSNVPGNFPAQWRVGLSATPRRKDGTEDVFRFHIGPMLFEAKEQRMGFTVKRVPTDFRLVKTETVNPAFVKEHMLLPFLCSNQARNELIVKLAGEALEKGRKILIVSKRLEHLHVLDNLIRRTVRPHPSIGWYVGGQTEDALDRASQAQVILGTNVFVSEGLDIPALDTLFLVTPLVDIEQIVGRIRRPFEGKRPPIVVDFVDERVKLFAGYAQARERRYADLLRFSAPASAA